MPDNNSNSGVAIVLTIAWIVFVVWYPRSWQPSTILLDPLNPAERACILKLPADGPLRLMIAQGSRLTLWFQLAKAGEPRGASASQVEAAAPGVPLPPDPDKREGVRVSGVTCLSADRQSDCYAVLALSVDDASTVMSAGRVWISLERQ